MDEEFFKRLGLSIARGVPQMATGFVDLAGLPFTMTGLLEPEEVVGSTAYLTSKGLLPPPQEGLLEETTEMVSGALNPAGAVKGGLLALGTMAGVKGGKSVNSVENFVKSFSDASSIFGEGAKRVKYVDPKSNGFIDLLIKPDSTVSVLSLEVPEQFRGKGIGKSLQKQAIQDFPLLQGQVSSKAAAKSAYNLGRRPPNMPDATLDDVLKMIDENSSVNLVTEEMQELFK